ncbi:MAG: hypothetical protein H7Y09_01940 [Chitinophagaceae bacterium]|nr:hypothetical protein [Anaerolineae bacterium]
MMPSMQHELNKLHQEELHRQAEQVHLAKQAAEPNQRTVFKVVMAEVGRQMVNLGERLQEQRQESPKLQPETVS